MRIYQRRRRAWLAHNFKIFEGEEELKNLQEGATKNVHFEFDVEKQPIIEVEMLEDVSNLTQE